MSSSDTPATESTGSLSLSQAANLLGGEPPKEEPVETTASPEPEKVAEETQADTEVETVDEPTTEAEKVTIEVDGKTVELTKAELAEHYKNGLRQADYTKKTMATAEVAKAAEAETTKAREARSQYADGLQQNRTLLVAALEEQNRIDVDALIQSDPVEYLKQKNLFERRQSALRETDARLAQVRDQEAQENVQGFFQHAAQEHQALLDKLPAWKDQAKATVEKQQIMEELVSRGFAREMMVGEYNPDGSPKLDKNGRIKNPGLIDHRIALLARDAMLYRKTMEQAQAAAKKVANLPQKVERPGVAETNPSDGRTVAMKRLQSSGSIRDAAAVFDRMFK